METLAIILSIVASILSIAATIVALKSKKEAQRLRDVYENNRFSVKGDANTQVIGRDNKVNTHDR